MRLKTFTAATVAEAMDLVYVALGGDAIVVSTREPAGDQAARVTAAVDDDTPVDLGPPEAETWAAADLLDGVRQTLAFHGIPAAPANLLVAGAERAGGHDPVAALAAALAAVFTFDPLVGATAGGRLMLVGPPGCGKTLATAKLAAAATRTGRPARAIAADGAGNGARLAALLHPWDLAPAQVEGPDDLARAAAGAGAGTALFIDTPAANPYNARDLDRLRRRVEASGAEPILVLAAGGDPVEAADHARVFAGLGVRRLLATRVDVARRLGSLLTAAHAARLAFAAVTADADPARAVTAIDAAALARLLLPDPAAAARSPIRNPSAEAGPPRRAGSPRKSEAAS